ncbi:MAG: ribosomal protein S7 domain-containing protein [Piptocephalis tieghemiana]|nr:MAG: ribosomal protein S7 domain-containing protein [Piptocephalis tieghemiana]
MLRPLLTNTLSRAQLSRATLLTSPLGQGSSRLAARISTSTSTLAPETSSSSPSSSSQASVTLALPTETPSLPSRTVGGRLSYAESTLLASDPLLSQLVNMIMRDGKKAKAQHTLSKALLIIRSLTGTDPYDILNDAIERASPIVKLLTTRRGSKNVPIPFPLSEKQRRRQAIVWLIKASEGRPERFFHERLAGEILAITEGQSSILTLKSQLYINATAARSNVSLPRGAKR